jgi:hypothetical protein
MSAHSADRVPHASRVLAKASGVRELSLQSAMPLGIESRGKACFSGTPKVRAGLAIARVMRALPE